MLLRLQAAMLSLGFRLLRAMPPASASNLGGAVARTIGPLLPVSRVADANLRLALPKLDALARRRVVRGVWDNVGRTIAELPHLRRLRETAEGPGWELTGAEVAARLVAPAGPGLFFSGHFGNWELLLPVAAARGMLIAGMYRAPTNPYVDRVITGLRLQAMGAGSALFAKGADGARAALRHLRAGGVLGLLTDQKMNDGIAAPLFGHPAMTASACASLALRFRCPLVPAYVERLGPARLRVVCEPPLPLPDSGDRLADIAALTVAMNDCLERWIRARPTDWLWLHRRWPKEAHL